MTINFDGNLVNLRDKINAADKKKGEPSVKESKDSKGSEKSEAAAESQKNADIIKIRNENKLAADSSIKNSEEAQKVVEELKKQFLNNAVDSLDAHKKASPEAVMRFYPFE